MAVPVISDLPPAPTRNDGAADFTPKSDAMIGALQPLVVQINIATQWMNGTLSAAQAAQAAAAASATAAAGSAAAAAGSASAATTNGAAQVALAAAQVGLATAQAQLATTNGQAQVALATTQANNAAASAATATAMAEAAGAAVGPPPVPNKFLGTDSAGNVAWRDAGQKIGDALFTARTPDATYLPLNGGVYSQTAYAALFGIVGLISGSFAEVWAAVTSNAGSNALTAIDTDDNGVMVAAGAAGTMVRSTDNGATWTAVTSGFGADAINGISCDRAGTWIAVGAAGKVSRSTNNGATWGIVTSGLVSADTLYSVASDRNSTFIAVAQLSSGSHVVIRSTNKGATWSTAVVNASPVAGYKGIATDRKGVWITTSSSSQFYRSVDDGATWVQVAGASGLAVARIATDGKGVWVASNNAASLAQAARSSDNGLTWFPVATPTPVLSSAIATDSNGTWIIGTTGTSMHRSTDNGLTWVSSTVAGLTGGALAAAFGKDGVAIAAAASGVLRRSVPTYGYDTATQFKLPNQPAAIGLAAYIKAKDA